MPVPLHLSIVLSTYNRANILPAAIDAVLAQAAGGPTFELVVVDNNSADDTRQVVERYAGRPGPEVRYVREERQGVAHARNTGIDHARAPIVAFVDDDVHVTPSWTAAIATAFAAHPRVDYIGGKVLPDWPRQPPAWLTRDHWAPLALFDYGDTPFEITLDQFRCLGSGNLACRRSMLRAVRFDAAHQHAAGSLAATEDHEFEVRLLRAGYVGLYVPTMVVTAPVQEERLTKAYHRKWHLDHGRAVGKMLRLGETVDPAGQPSADITLFGIPAWIFRKLGQDAVGYVRETARRRKASAFVHQSEILEMIGNARYCSGRYRAQTNSAVPAEVARFARDMLARRHAGRPASR